MRSVGRTVVERLLRDTHVWRSLPNGRKIAVSPDSQLRYLAPTFDSDLFRLSREFVKRGDVVWDIGANCGTFSFSCDQARDVLAVEADPFLCALISRSIERNKSPVRLLEGAISNRRGTADFSISSRGRASSHLTDVAGSTQSGGERNQISVLTYTLDTLPGPDPDFVKIDIEMAELLALQGAPRLLREVRPLVYIELSGECLSDCRGIFEDAGYELTLHHGKNWIARPS